MEFLILQAITTFFKSKVFIYHFLLHLSYMCKFREKKSINVNNLIVETRKVNRIEKEIVLTNSEEKLCLQRNDT